MVEDAGPLNLGFLMEHCRSCPRRTNPPLCDRTRTHAPTHVVLDEHGATMVWEAFNIGDADPFGLTEQQRLQILNKVCCWGERVIPVVYRQGSSTRLVFADACRQMPE